MACTIRLDCGSHGVLQLDSTFVLSSHSSGRSFFYFVHCDLDQYILSSSLELFVSLDYSDCSSTILDHSPHDSFSAASDFNSYLYVHLPHSFARLVVYSDILPRSSNVDAHVALRTSPEWNRFEIDLLAVNPFFDGWGRRPRVDLLGKHLDLSSSSLSGNLFHYRMKPLCSLSYSFQFWSRCKSLAFSWTFSRRTLSIECEQKRTRSLSCNLNICFTWLEYSVRLTLGHRERQAGVHFSSLSSCSRWTFTQSLGVISNATCSGPANLIVEGGSDR